MSGGVDSSVTAAILKSKGATVVGVFMELVQPDLEEQIERVRKIADFLDIPLTQINLRDIFQKEVLDYFAQAYFSAKTPNPCIVCNRKVKCGALLDSVRSTLGVEYLATGHYARLTAEPSGKISLLKGRDFRKDQSYFLSWLRQEQLRHLLFPLGEMEKKDVVRQAEDLGLGGRHGEESQDVCFLKHQSVQNFLTQRQGEKDLSGPVMTTEGKVVGRHPGIHGFTVGQRRGLGIPDSTPYYVVELDLQDNAVIIGKEADLLHSVLEIADINWLEGAPPELPEYYEVKIRYRHTPARARVEATGERAARLIFETPQRAATPGQYAAIYSGDKVIGAGEIINIKDTY